MTESSATDEERRLIRWRLVLGGGNSDGTGVQLSQKEDAIDRAISALYDGGLSKSGERKGALGGSSPTIANWLGDIRRYFPSSVVQVMQQDALDRLNLRQLIFEPELLAAAEPDIHLVTTLIALKSLIPQRTRATARQVVQKVVDQILARITGNTVQSVSGSLNRSVRNDNPRHSEIDWKRTIKANLKHYQDRFKTVIPERRIGYGRKRSSLLDIILCIDQSGSMAESVVYGAVFGAVLASLPSVSTRLITFDTSVVDLTEQLSDPVDLLFGVQLGGGTDINQALSVCQSFVHRPENTIIVLLSDLYEGSGNPENFLQRAAALKKAGVNVIALLALSDSGAPSFEQANASRLASLSIPSFACTPDQFPDLLSAAIQGSDLFSWASSNGLLTARTSEQ